MTLRAALVLLLWPAMACADICSDLRDLVDHAEGGDFQISQIEIAAGTPECSVSQDERGGRTTLCFWTFAYRDTAATTAFERLDQDVRRCFSDATILPADSTVNHPDSYQLRRYQRGRLVISVSLKDKAALSQSLVFLRIDRQ
ncbi:MULTISPECIES: hypothetical protein [unclassified Roseovarius]|uniref:hypothetical protein n=1 Tax=unclassified Roseovarius TaxID=2614913 RepID=UPI00273FA497|nr:MULTISPECIES: hypothetical protein [unclassified Roseovarius]